MIFLQSSNDQKEKQLRELTQLCLSIGILFLVCESPRTILPIYHRFVDRTLTSRLIANISYILTAFDHSMNFFIYVLRGERFRKDLFQLMPCCRHVFGGHHRKHELRSVTSEGSVAQTDFSNVVSETDCAWWKYLQFSLIEIIAKQIREWAMLCQALLRCLWTK